LGGFGRSAVDNGVQWIMECVTTLCYSVHFNNIPLDSFKPLCTLPQGDPLLPYLFLFVADGLSQILQNEVRSGALHELHICKHSLGISHVLFADDTLLFMEAEEEQARVINKALQLYEKCIGQLTNLDKCSMMFGANYSEQSHDRVRKFSTLPTLLWRKNTWGCQRQRVA
jgi:hypothetical protein